MLRVRTQAEVIDLFGDPAFLTGNSGVDLVTWESRILATIAIPAPLPLSWIPEKKVSTFRCHHLIAVEMRALFIDLHNASEVWDSLHDFGGCYNFREIANSPGNLSRHSWGIALDLNVRENPRGYFGTCHPRLLEIMTAYGFMWGNRFSTPDPMHWEYGIQREE